MVCSRNFRISAGKRILWLICALRFEIDTKGHVFRFFTPINEIGAFNALIRIDMTNIIAHPFGQSNKKVPHWE